MFLSVPRTILMLWVSSLVVLSGCDDRNTDRKVRRDVTRSHDLAMHGTPESLNQAKQLLESASAGSASPALQANAKSLLAQVELESARAAQREIDRKMMDLSRLSSDITRLGQQIATTNALIAGYQTYDPAKALAAIQQNIAEATGGADKPAWFTHENAQIPTLSVLKQEIARLEGEISRQQEKLNQLTAQRLQVLSDADQASRAAEEPGSGRSLDAFKRASDLRKQAADLSTDIQNVEAALMPLRTDLEIDRGQEEIITKLINDLTQQAQALQTGWQHIQQQMAAQAALAQAILQGAAGSPSAASVVPVGGSIGNKATELSAIVEQLGSLREEALNAARNAASHYEQAAAKAQEVGQELGAKIADPANSSRPEQNSWKVLRDLMYPATFKLNQAAAERTLATILASQAQELEMRMELRNALGPILEAARLSMPDQLVAGNAERDREKALTEANAAFETANGLLEGITEGQAQPEVQNAAYAARVLTLYAWSQLNQEAGDEKAATEHLELARQVRNAATDRGIALPAMPAGLGAPPKPAGAEPPATAPADQPADAPANQP